MASRPAAQLTVLHHLHELRRRLMYSVSVMVVGGILGYLIRAPLIAALQHPLGQKLFYTSPTGSFEFVVQICLLVGFLVALPVACYNLLRFIEPALPQVLSWRLILAIIMTSYALTIAGVAFAYYVSLPAALHFFNSIGTSNLHPLISIDQYTSFVFGYFATFAIIFQLPLLLLFINTITPLGPKGLSKWRKWVVIAAFSVAIILPSAPDPLSQIILALPIIALYEVSIWLVWLVNRRRLRVIAPASVTQPAAAPSSPRQPSPTPARSPISAPAPIPPSLPLAYQPIIDLRNLAPQLKPRPVNILDLREHSS